MTNIWVFGGTGYAGSAIVSAAVGRGHAVTAVSRRPPAEPVADVAYVQGTAAEIADQLTPDVDVIVAALSPRGDLAGRLRASYAHLADAAVRTGARLIVVGGFSSLRPDPDSPRFIESPLEGPYVAEAQEMDGIRGWLETEAPAGLTWLFVSPGLGFSSANPGVPTGHYRIGGSVAQLDASGQSDVSGADFALAVVDEIESRAHAGHIGVAY